MIRDAVSQESNDESIKGQSCCKCNASMRQDPFCQCDMTCCTWLLTTAELAWDCELAIATPAGRARWMNSTTLVVGRCREKRLLYIHARRSANRENARMSSSAVLAATPTAAAGRSAVPMPSTLREFRDTSSSRSCGASRNGASRNEGGSVTSPSIRPPSLSIRLPPSLSIRPSPPGLRMKSSGS